MATPSNTDVQGFLTAALGVRDAWSNLNPNDPNSRAALASAITGLAASVTTLITDNPTMGTWANRLVFFSSVFLTLLLSAPTSAQDNSPVERALHPSVSLDTGVVGVRFGNRVYAIPRNYLSGVTQPRDGNPYASFTVQVLLPDFMPRTPQNAARFNEVGWHDQFRALFEYPRHPKRPEEILDFYLKLAGKSRDVFQLVGSGYRFYESVKTVPHEMFTKDTPNGLLFFTCEDAKYLVPSPDCTVNESFGDDIGVIYHFSRKYMDRTADIDMKLHALLGTFLKK